MPRVLLDSTSLSMQWNHLKVFTAVLEIKVASVIITAWLWEVSYIIVQAITCSPRKIGAYLLL